MEHQWVGHVKDCAQLGKEMFFECSVCGLSRGHQDKFVYAGLLEDNASGTRFSFDCEVAQQELRMYLRGRLDGLSRALQAEKDPDGVLMVNLVRTALEGSDVSIFRVFPALVVIERMRSKRPWHEDIRAMLYGRPSGPPLEDVEL